MLGPREKALIRRLSSAYPEPSSALLPALDCARRSAAGALSHQDVRAVAGLLGISPARAWGAATYYSTFRIAPAGKYHLQVDTNIAAMLAGSDSVLAGLEENLGIRTGETTTDGLFTLSAVEDLGAGGVSPALLVNDSLFGNMTAAKADTLVAGLRKGRMPPRGKGPRAATVCSLLIRDTSRGIFGTTAGGRYGALEIAGRMEPEEIITLVEQSGLRGRGGAAYPTGRKWRLPARRGRPVYLICNADEGEPGTFKDRHILEHDPHLLLEGIAIAARALRSRTAFVYIRGEYRSPGESLERAAEDARKAGFLTGLDLIVHYGAGSYLCGEETALISSLEGGRGEPRPKPPYPVQRGLYGCPTVVNNVETLAALPSIVTGGPEAFRRSSPLLFSVCGHVNLPGVYEFPLGTPLATLLEAAGGVNGALKAVLVGGLSSRILRADRAERLILDYGPCREAGTSLGSGSVIVMNDTVSISRIADRAAAFFSSESCGLCAPCREGMYVIRRLLRQFREGSASRRTSSKVLELCHGIRATALCPGGISFASSIEAMLSSFPEEFSA